MRFLQGRVPYFLILLPVFFVLHGYTFHYGLVNATEAVVLALKYTGFSLLICGLAWILLRDIIKAALFTFILMGWNFFFGPAHDFLAGWMGNSFITRYSFIIPFSVVVILVSLVLLKKSKKNFQKVSLYLSLLFLLLIVIDCITIIGKAGKREKETAEYQSFAINSCDSCVKNDIYLIVADEYAGSDQLKEDFGFDNSGFENELENRGFRVIRNARSNYNSTPFSLASFFSMNFIDSLENNFNEKNLHSAYKLINSNPFTGWLKREGYDIKNYSVFRFGGQNTVTSTGFVASGTGLFTIHTFLGRFDRDLRFNFITRLKWKSEIKRFVKNKAKENDILVQRTEEEAATASTRPRFVYLHTMMPHFPYLFDKSGNPDYIHSFEPENRFNKEAYINYLQYSNTVFLKLIDQVRAHSKNAVIIFMGDHGFRHIEPLVKERHFKIFNAILLPGAGGERYAGYHDGLSLVNFLRVYLNKQGNQLPVLKDSTVFLENWW